MSTKHDGGPAFPGPCQRATSEDIHEGMSVKTYATIKIMAALCANPSVFQQCPLKGWTLANATPEQLADYAAYLADEAIRAAGN